MQMTQSAGSSSPDRESDDASPLDALRSETAALRAELRTREAP